MAKTIDLEGCVFSRLTVLRKAEKSGRSQRWECKCECGNNVLVDGGNLRSGHTRSCGCYARERSSETRKKLNPTHGMTHTRFYSIWRSMIKRCCDKSHSHYDSYGGRGITIDTTWLNSFESFYRDMYESYQHHIDKHGEKGTSIDRINNDGNYEKENCKWSTPKEQMRNRRNCTHIPFCGEILTAAEIGERYGLSPELIRLRFKKGWLNEKMVIPPLKSNVPKNNK